MRGASTVLVSLVYHSEEAKGQSLQLASEAVGRGGILLCMLYAIYAMYALVRCRS
jgi:hypothetical protein